MLIMRNLNLISIQSWTYLSKRHGNKSNTLKSPSKLLLSNVFSIFRTVIKDRYISIQSLTFKLCFATECSIHLKCSRLPSSLGELWLNLI